MNKNFSKTAIIGSSGFLGQVFLSVYRKVYPDCIATTRSVSDKSKNIFSFNLLNPNIRPLYLSKSGHKEALILAAVANIDECEKHKRATRKINVDGTLELIHQLSGEGIKPVFFSSDYVFDGGDGAYSDAAATNPIAEYGRQKAEVEAKIVAITKGNFLVVRLSKVFSLVKNDGTLLDEMAHILSSGGIVQAPYDQIFCPTLVSDIVNAVAWLQAQGAKGVVNACSPETWSRYDLAVSLAKVMGVDMSKVKKVRLEEIMVNKKRPKNTSMIPNALLRSNVAFISISSCIQQIANNWAKASS
jgi:dTDP-4-dehydrorhamnose reductase